MDWQPIETAPRGSRKVIVLISDAGPDGYVTDPWTGWVERDGKFARWPHKFPPTHWLELPPFLNRYALTAKGRELLEQSKK